MSQPRTRSVRRTIRWTDARLWRLEDRLAPAGTWVAQGPGPILNGQVEGMGAQQNPVAGAIHAVLPHPTDPNTLYVGGANGGVWKTTNALLANPTWQPLTDLLPRNTVSYYSAPPTTIVSTPGLSISDLRFDPSDASYQTIVASYGRFSSYYQDGGQRSGLLRSTDGGQSWSPIGQNLTPFGPTPIFDWMGRNVTGFAARGTDMIMTATAGEKPGGVFYATAQFQILTQIDGTNGLPAGPAFGLAEDPRQSGRMFIATSSGIYKTDHFPVTPWVNITPPGPFPSPFPSVIGAATTNIEMAVHSTPSGTALYVAVINTGRLAGLFRSPGFGVGWQTMDLPEIIENTMNPITGASFQTPIRITSNNHGQNTNDKVFISGVTGNTAANGTWTITRIDANNFDLQNSVGNGFFGGSGTWQAVQGLQPREHPGSQGSIHFSIVADPNDPNVVYVGGDRQPLSNGALAGTFPNAIGAMDFTGRLFRGNATFPPGSQWTHITHTNANGTAPHADSRDMAFDALGNLIQGDDGGVYRLSTPQFSGGSWTSLNGNLQVNEVYPGGVAYDPLNNVFIAGSQDTGSSTQMFPGSTTWDTLNKGDGGMTAARQIGPTTSVRYHSSQTLGGFTRKTYDATNTLMSSVAVGLNVTADPNGGPIGGTLHNLDSGVQFVTPWALNRINPNRMLIGTNNYLYESTNQGDSLTRLNFNAPASFIRGLAYGDVANADLIIYGGNTFATELMYRTTPGGPLTLSTAFPGHFVVDIAVHPTLSATNYVVDTQYRVYGTSNNGGAWSDLTGDLHDVPGDVRSIVAIPGYVVVGKQTGVYYMNTSVPGVWRRLGNGMPNVPVSELGYDSADGVLFAGTLGRGVWSLPNVLTHFADVTPPTAIITPVGTITAPIDSMNIVFSEAVTGLETRDVVFRVNGIPQGINGPHQNLTTTDGITWTIRGLRLPTSQTLASNYSLEIASAATTKVYDGAGNLMTSFPSYSFSGAHNVPYVYRVEALSPPDGTRVPNSLVEIDVEFAVPTGQTLSVTGGVPTLQLNIGTAYYVSHTPAGKVRFNFFTQYGMNAIPLDIASTTALSLNGATISSAGGPANLTLPAPGTIFSLGSSGMRVLPRATVGTHSPLGLRSIPTDHVDIFFPQGMDTTSFDLLTDIVSFTGPTGDLIPQITGYSWPASIYTLRISFNPQSTTGGYSLVLSPDIQSLIGVNSLDQDGDNLAGEPIDDRYYAFWQQNPLVVNNTSDLDDGLYFGPGALSLREALVFANNDPFTIDSITFDAGVFGPGTNIITTGLTISGPVTITAPAYPTGSRIGLSGNGANRTLRVDLSPTRASGANEQVVTLQHLNLIGGNTTGDGGNLLVLDGIVTLLDATVSGGVAANGAGIAFTPAPLVVNNEPGHGLTLERVTIMGNAANAAGGGLHMVMDLSNSSLVDMKLLQVSGNFAATNGGGMNITGALPSSIYLRQSTVSGNTAGQNGGGVRVAGTNGGLVLSESTVSGNTAFQSGGGVSADSLYLGVQNSTIANNYASIAGGGIDLAGTAALVAHFMTVAFNSAGSGGGMRLAATSYTNISTTIVGKNSAATGPDISGSVNLMEYSLVMNTAGATLPPHPTNKLGVDPQFVTSSPANNGGPTGTLALQPFSPAIDAGRTDFAISSWDQRNDGYTRWYGSATDMGAYERQPVNATVARFALNQNLTLNSPQRSRVISLTVYFTQTVTLPANPVNAFQLVRQSDSATIGLGLSTSSTAPTTIQLHFLPGPLVEFGSLADGRYTLRVFAAAVNSGVFDGNGDGVIGDDYVHIGNPSPGSKLYRQFGDENGDGFTDNVDFIAFRNANGASGYSPPYNPAFDFDADGNIDLNDFIAFRQRIGAVA